METFKENMCYYQYTYYGGTMGKKVFWAYEKWDVYQKKQGKKSESDALVSSDIYGGEF